MALIVFEGLDGSGKTTQLKKLAEYLRNQGEQVIETGEPGGSRLGDELRQILLRKHDEAFSPRAELLIYEAIRSQHVDQKLKKYKNTATWVLCDRFAASSLAFQSAGRSIDPKDVEWLNQFAVQKCWPDLTVLVDTPVAECRKRRLQGRGTEDRIESEKDDFHERVRTSFLDQAQKNNYGPWLVLSGLQAPDQLFAELQSELRKRKFLK